MQRREDLPRVVAVDEGRRPPLTGEERLDVRVGCCDRGRSGPAIFAPLTCRIGNTAPSRSGLRKAGSFHERGQRSGLGLAVSDHARHQQVGSVERRPGGMRERVAEFAALVDAARRLHADVARDAARRRELPAEPVRSRRHRGTRRDRSPSTCPPGTWRRRAPGHRVRDRSRRDSRCRSGG